MIHLSPPNVGAKELEELEEVIASGWIAPAGPRLSLFEKQLERLFEKKRVLALNSGTAALHLALIQAGVGSGDEVLVGSFTFTACVNVVRYQNATPVFIDSEPETWNLDPQLLEAYLAATKKMPKAVIVNHLYGVPAKIEEIGATCTKYGITLIEDAAEGLGSTYKQRPVGSFGARGVLSFNGNKIITTSGGGALIGNDQDHSRGLHLATQANSGTFDYEHLEVGYNYRMSNVLAGLGVAQLAQLDTFVAKKRQIYQSYQSALSSLFEFSEEPKNTFCNRWLTTPLIRKELLEEKTPLALVQFLAENFVEARLLWKPLHLQPVNKPYVYCGGKVAEEIYSRGICLPSGSNLSEEDLERTVALVQDFFESV